MKNTNAKMETRQTAWTPSAPMTDTAISNGVPVHMVVTEYGIRFVEFDSPDRSRTLSCLASLGSCLAHVTKALLLASTRFLSVVGTAREPSGVAEGDSGNTPSAQDRPHVRRHASAADQTSTR